MDVHVTRVATRLNLLKANPNRSAVVGWQSALELTSYLRSLDENDPVKYDFAYLAWVLWNTIRAAFKHYRNMDNDELGREINNTMAIEAAPGISMDDLQQLVADHVNNLIQHNFQKLITVLYRVDVSEIKLKQLLQENPGLDAGKIIGGLIIERQIQKIKTRQQFSKRDNNFTGEEKW
jgi:hypothetical protein